ncbi:hypothetical protein OS42_16290 [Dickeya oryzae]
MIQNTLFSFMLVKKIASVAHPFAFSFDQHSFKKKRKAVLIKWERNDVQNKDKRLENVVITPHQGKAESELAGHKRQSKKNHQKNAT